MVDGGDSPLSAPAPPGAAAATVEDYQPFADVRLTEAPILLLVFFHKALRAEFKEIRRLVSVALESGSQWSELVLEAQRRLEFLKLAYKYHCAAEDEVIFLALDAHINNVACTYSLEHKSIDGLFASVFHCFSVLTKDNGYNKPLQELASSIGTLHSTICKHMIKEEKQVFPLLMQQFSSIEQASLVWQFLCNVPITLLEDILPWMTSYLSPNEQVDVLCCMKELVPKENILQEVVLSWLVKKSHPSFGAYTESGEGAQSPDGPEKSKDLHKEHPTKNFTGMWKKAYFLQTNIGHDPIDGVRLWHGAIRKDLKEILEELYQIRSSDNYLDLSSVIVQLKFLADVLTFYSNALDKIFYPVLKEVANRYLSLSCGRFLSESQIEGLQRSLYYNAKNGIPVCKFVEKLCRQVESFIDGIMKQFAFQEREVFPLISENCNHETQQQLLYTSLRMMPLGLLKCVITWFSAHLSEDQSMSILCSIKQGCPLVNKSFASLLFEWVRSGYSGKTSVEKFRKDLQKMFETKCFFLPEQIKQDSGSSSAHSDAQPCNISSPSQIESVAVKMAKNVMSNSSFGSQTPEMYATSYSSGINMHIFFPGTIEILCPFPKFPGEESNGNSILNLEPRPMDHIFFFHKALKKDLEYLVYGSAQLADNLGLLLDFHRRFHLMQFLYQIHSDAEDEVAFPALEAKGEKGQNISHSYSIDHKIEADHFNDISLVLYEMSEVHVSISSTYVDNLDKKKLKYRQLCMKLHDMCKSMHKMLCDHMHHEEVEVWPLFRECFSIHEQEKIIGYMLGRTRAEMLQDMIPWLMAYLTPEEQHAMMSLWRKATKNTMFDEWLREWWVDMRRYDIANTTEVSSIHPSSTTDPLELISTYLSKEDFSDQGGSLCEKGVKHPLEVSAGVDIVRATNHNEDNKGNGPEGDEHKHQCSECTELFRVGATKKSNEVPHVTDQQLVSQKFRQQEKFLSMSQEELEATIRRVSRDSSLDPQKKSSIIQNLLMSRWIVKQQKSSEATSLNADEIPGRCPSYRDPLKLTFGCQHYKRNCKLVAACCNQLYACRYCHDDAADHSMDRKVTTSMMCMKCLIIQPIGPTCSTASCSNLSMAKYYCRICKLFDDERDIYHCPYCNLCRVGKGLGIDYFHCMNCNACMSRSLSVHVCREKSFEDNCPICHEYIFTSSAPVKALPCGHMMHSACFQDYTCTHYTCPICSKSLGDMQVYFGMLDALLAEEKISDNYSGQTKVILCNDCEKKGTAPHHWLYHKCPDCGSYNTRLL